MKPLQGVLMSAGGGVYRVSTKHGVVEASIRGKLKQAGRAQVVVGDTVTLEAGADGSHTIESRLARRNALRRRTPGKRRGVRVIAANVDQILVVGAVQRPEWDYHLIDRFLAVAEANHIGPVLVINKSDLDPEAESLGAVYTKAGYRVLVTSVSAGSGIDELKRLVQGHISLFTGSTGVGKSSLVNVIEPGLSLRVGQISEKAQAGKHTTVAAEMFPLTGGGFLVDTPGLRDVGLWALSPTEVVAAFPEFGPHAERCRFDDCRHLEEPACGVLAACETGEIAATRLTSYRRFLEEASQAARPWE